MNPENARKVLQEGLLTGGDFSELFVENTIHHDLELSSGHISKTNTSQVYGAGIRILHQDEEVYAYTNNLSQLSLLNLANKLAQSFNYPQVKTRVDFKVGKLSNKHTVNLSANDTSMDKKVTYMNQVYEVAKNYHEKISQVIVSLMDDTQEIEIFNSEGISLKDSRHHIRLAIRVVASDQGVMQVATDSIGGNIGYELFDQRDLVKFAKDTAESAIQMLYAKEMVGQMLPVVIHNGFGGVILHEACGHALEATSVAKNLSVFSHKLGDKIASEIVNAVDDGTLTNSWGSLNIDDEGTETKRNVLIENGILKSYLVDKRNARKMNHEITGSSRRQSYRYSPTSRMTNTFFENGESSFESIIQDTEYGFFAKKMGGGSVNTTTGEFNFVVNEGYMIEKGKISYPVRGATLVGNGADVLKKIDRIADNLSFGHGVCGSVSGNIPTDVGQPTIRVQEMTVGGRGGK